MTSRLLSSGILIMFVNFIENFEKVKIIVNYSRNIDTIFKETIVYESLKYGGKQKSVALLVKDLGI